MPITSWILLTFFLGIIILVLGLVTKKQFLTIISLLFILFSLATAIVLFLSLKYM